MFERENRFVAMEYDDCDVTVSSGAETIDDHMRSIGFQVWIRKFLISDRSVNFNVKYLLVYISSSEN